MKSDGLQSPQIVALSWGHMRIDGVGAGKDFKVWPGGGRAWDWRETNTHHRPGIQPADIAELLEHGSRSVVLSRGMLLKLCTCPEALELLAAQGIDVHVEETQAAAEIYNSIAVRGERVGGLFHSTC